MTAGRIVAVDTAAADIVGFDPTRDRLDLGDVSVHNFLVVDTPAGVGFLNPWSGDMIVVQRVSLGQLTIDSFMPVINDPLRQRLSGALAWELGVVEANEAFKVNLTSPTGATIADGTAVATITSDNVAASGGALGYAVTSDWGAGFTATMTVDAGSTALNGWTAEFDATFTITNIWNAVIVSHVGNHYVIRNETYNATVAAGGDAGGVAWDGVVQAVASAISPNFSLLPSSSFSASTALLRVADTTVAMVPEHPSRMLRAPDVVA